MTKIPHEARLDRLHPDRRALIFQNAKLPKRQTQLGPHQNLHQPLEQATTIRREIPAVLMENTFSSRTFQFLALFPPLSPFHQEKGMRGLKNEDQDLKGNPTS